MFIILETWCQIMMIISKIICMQYQITLVYILFVITCGLTVNSRSGNWNSATNILEDNFENILIFVTYKDIK